MEIRIRIHDLGKRVRARRRLPCLFLFLGLDVASADGWVKPVGKVVQLA